MRVEFYQLGFEPVVEMAAEHGEGVGDLLDEIIQRLPAQRDAGSPRNPEETAVAIVGRPNVGKSSLLNRLLHEERSIVSEMPGTTRDTVDAVLKWHHRTFRIVDTAGIRRAGRVARSGQLESLSVILARRAIEKADVAVLRGRFDRRGHRSGRDDRRRSREGRLRHHHRRQQVGPDEGAGHEFLEDVRRQAPPADEVPRLRADPAHLRHDRRARREGARDDRQGRRGAAASGSRPAELNRFLQTVTAAHPPASPGRRQVRIMYATQKGVAPPTFVSSPTSRPSFISPTSGSS